MKKTSDRKPTKNGAASENKTRNGESDSKKGKKTITFLSVAVAVIVCAVIVMSLFLAGTFDIALKGNISNNEDGKSYGTFTDYVFDEKNLPSGRYATITFLCQNTRYPVKVYLFDDYAPNTVSNFVSHANAGFYNGTAVGEVTLTYDKGTAVGGKMILGGFLRNADGSLSVKLPEEVTPIKGEFAENGYTKNKLSNTAGVLGMLHSKNNDDATTDFYILPYDDTSLNGLFAAFGKITNYADLVTVRKLSEKAYRERIAVSVETIKITGKN